ncbi:MAG: OB-fold domain-containing protein [Chloroflexota bacterium]|nr:OB-fold domain-containing protein [Chloroflexota bacterium]
MDSKDSQNKQIPALEGWFSWPPSDEPYLIGSRCKSCGDYFFPKTTDCVNPKCMSTDMEEAPLSRKGKLFTYTINYFQPPPPYIPPDPFVPYATAVMELDKEKMKVQGQIVSDYDFDKLEIGMDIEVALELLHKDEQGREVIVWKFKPC